jgi:integrase
MAKRKYGITPTPGYIRGLPPGRHFDANGLYLQIAAGTSDQRRHFRELKEKLKDKVVSLQEYNDEVRKHSPDFNRSWLFIYKPPARKLRYMGLGSWPKLLPTPARNLATEQQKLRAQGKDPITEWRRTRKRAAIVEEQDTEDPTFKRMAEAYMVNGLPMFKAWRDQFQLYVYNHPAIANVPFYDLTARHIARVIDEPMKDKGSSLWETKTPTAKELMRRMEKVIDFANHRHNIRKPNPARWKGSMEFEFAQRQKKEAGNDASLPYKRIKEFMAEIMAKPTITSLAVQFIILTCVRAGKEARLAQWKEIDLKERTWTIPAQRMKTRKLHKVPLSERTIHILKEVQKFNLADPDNGDAWIFPTDRKEDMPLSKKGIDSFLIRLNEARKKAGKPLWVEVQNDDWVTIHGFRGTFRTWANEETDYPHEVKEAALAHAISNDVEKRYVKGSLFEKRKLLMQDWATYCTGKTSKLKKASSK